MKLKNTQLIAELLEISNESTAIVNALKSLDAETLNYKPSPEQWSILECIEHLNLYGDFYLPVIENAIFSAATVNDGVFSSGVIGNFLVNTIKVKPGKVKKMSAVKEMDPNGRLLPVTTLDRFLKQQYRLTEMLEQARGVDMVGAKTPISLTKLIKLRLGDTLRFMVYHIERHVLQAQNLNGLRNK